MVKTWRPATLAEALEIRSNHQALPMAGGTDLMVRYRAKNGLAPTIPGPVLFVDALSELRGASLTGSALILGASLPIAVIADDPGSRDAYESDLDENPVVEGALDAIPAVLRDSAADLGAPGLRQRAVLAGNVANASPAGDTVAALYALDAAVVLASVKGERGMPLSEFITGPGRTLLAEDELITAFRLPAAPLDWCYWRKVGTRKANALTKVSVAAAARIDDGRVASFSLAFGAVGPTVVRIPEAEALVLGAGKEGIDIAAVQEVIRPHIKPIDDQRSTAEYRKAVALNLAGEALSSLATKLKETNHD